MFGLILIAVGLRVYVTEAFKVPSASMWPTIMVQDHIFVSKFARIPDYGEVIVFAYPSGGNTDYVKRAIALTGDHVQFEGSLPIINGWRVPRCPIGKIGYPDEDKVVHEGEAFVESLGKYRYLVWEERDTAGVDPFQFDVPRGEVFVVGDNRSNSLDSRYWNEGKGGAVAPNDVKGRGSIVWLSFDEKGNINTERMIRHFADPPLLPKWATVEVKAKFEACMSNAPSQTRPPKRTR